MTVGEAPKPKWRRRLEVFLHVVTALFAVVALVVGYQVWRSEVKGQPVAAAFTRVGGRTRIETAVEASRFWRKALPKKKSIVITRAYESPDVLWGAATCAALNKVPLLFTELTQKRHLNWRQKRVVDTAVDRLRGSRSRTNAEHTVFTTRQVDECQREYKSNKWWSHHKRIPFDPLLLPGFKQQRTLAPVVVFATRKAPENAPDVAVGLALAAHMAQVRRENKAPDQDVSLVVVPSYLEAGPRLEDELREQPKLVKSGLVVGQTKVFSDDMRALLRQLLTSTNRQGILGALQDNLGKVQTLLAALLALIAFETASRLIPELVVLLGRRGPEDPAPRPSPPPPSPLPSPVPLQANTQKKRGHMRHFLAWLLRFRSLLGLLGAAVVIYSCVILWWHTHALATFLIVGSVLLLLAFLVDWDSIVLVWHDRPARSHKKQVERQWHAARQLSQEDLATLLAPENVLSTRAESAAIPRHFSEGRETALELIEPLSRPSRAVGCRVDHGDDHYYTIPDIEPQRTTWSLTYRAHFPGDFPDAEPRRGTHTVSWFELSDDLKTASAIASEDFPGRGGPRV